MITSETTFYVRYAETDAMRVVHHANYVVWFEEGRSHLMRACGASYADLEAQGYFLAISELEARYLAPARYGEQVTVQACLESVRSRSLEISYQVRNTASGQLLVTGRTTLVCIDRAGQVTRLPAGWRALLTAAG